MKIKSLEDIKEEKERQPSQILSPHKGAGKWKGGVPVSPTLVMPNTVFYPGMQPWAGNPPRPFPHGNPFKFVAKPASNPLPPPKTVEASPKAIESLPKAVETPKKAAKAFPEAVKHSTVVAVHEPKLSETSPSVKTRQTEGERSTDSKRQKSPMVHKTTEVGVTVT